MQARISLKYNGPAVDSGRMDAYEAAANMVAFSDFVVQAAKSLYGESSQVRADVAGFGRGSFITDLFFEAAGPMATLVASGTAKELLEIVGESISLWKHLKGTPPAAVDRIGDEFHVTNRDGNVIQISHSSVSLVFSEKGAASASRFVRDALSREGVDSVSINEPDREICSVSRSEAGFFVPVAPETSLFEHTFEMALMIEAPVFKDARIQFRSATPNGCLV